MTTAEPKSSRRFYAVVVTVVLIATGVFLQWRVSVKEKEKTVASAIANPLPRTYPSVPATLRGWIGPPNEAGIYEFAPEGACLDALEAPLILGPDVTRPSKETLDQIEASVVKLLAPVVKGDYQQMMDAPVEPMLRRRDAGVETIRHGWGETSAAYRELLDRSISNTALVAADMDSQTRVYAITEPVNVALSFLLDRTNVLAPRVACGTNKGYTFKTPSTSFANRGIPDGGPRFHDGGAPKAGWEMISVSLFMFFSDMDGDQVFYLGLRRLPTDDATIIVTTPHAPFQDRVLDAIEPLFAVTQTRDK